MPLNPLDGVRLGKPCIQLKWSDENVWKDYCGIMQGDGSKQVAALNAQRPTIPPLNVVFARFRVGPAQKDYI